VLEKPNVHVVWLCLGLISYWEIKHATKHNIINILNLSTTQLLNVVDMTVALCWIWQKVISKT